eukprot:GFYU01001997.1.p1 GENE.GFYU01001997.1~~GFYU01001997.1.p1  ORF type:complete len:277 (+),score=69.06 GFYU01001997.1:95-925(+)
MQAYSSYTTLKVTEVSPFVYNVELARPKALNAMNKAFWKEVPDCFGKINRDPNCRAVVLTAQGKHFSSGLDLNDMASTLSSEAPDAARGGYRLLADIPPMQFTMTSIEKCDKPVLVGIHGACIGGGIDLIAACDIRYCTKDAFFSIKEVDIGLAADVGTLQRLPKIIGNDSIVRELAYSCRKWFAPEAEKMGMVSSVFETREEMVAHITGIAKLIATKSPVAVMGTKNNLVYSRDHTVQEGLDRQAVWNAAFLQTEDIPAAVTAFMSKQEATFSKL